MQRGKGKPSPRQPGDRASKRSRQEPTEAQLRDLVERATVDCYNESEQMTGFYTMIEEYLAVPFQTSVLGVEVTVEMVDLTDAEEIVVVCRREDVRQRRFSTCRCRIHLRMVGSGSRRTGTGLEGDGLLIYVRG